MICKSRFGYFGKNRLCGGCGVKVRKKKLIVVGSYCNKLGGEMMEVWDKENRVGVSREGGKCIRLLIFGDDKFKRIYFKGFVEDVI